MEKRAGQIHNNIETAGMSENSSKTKPSQKIFDAIDRMHQMDLASFKTRNTELFITLVTDDCIMLPPGIEPLCGRDAIRDYLDDKFLEWESYEFTRYDQKLEEIKVMGDTAYEWGTINGISYMKSGGPDIFENTRFFRILRSQTDGSWKIARLMWHDVP